MRFRKNEMTCPRSCRQTGAKPWLEFRAADPPSNDGSLYTVLTIFIPTTLLSLPFPCINPHCIHLISISVVEDNLRIMYRIH